ncbi:MAG: hypothetical protein ACREJ0_19160 [Geminicoccaceae bacterium]
MSGPRNLGQALLMARRDAADLAPLPLPWYAPGRIPPDLVRKPVVKPGGLPIIGA